MHKQQKHLINCTTPQFQQLRHTLKDTLIHTQKQCDNKGRWPGSWHSALSSLYLDYIFMYFYFLGSPTGDSQNGSSGVNFTEHGFLSDRGCSQPIFHGWSKQKSSERGSGDRCSLKIQWLKERKKKNRATDNDPRLSWAAVFWMLLNQFVVGSERFMSLFISVSFSCLLNFYSSVFSYSQSMT